MRTVAFVALACLGCSSHYVPRARGRIAVTMQTGKPVYVRDGVPYEHGMLGGGLVRVVDGNPAAVAAATEYHDRLRTGVLETVLGAVAMIGGVTAGVAQAVDDPYNTHQRGVGIAAAVALGGAIVMLVGAGTAASAEPYRWDAINIFNDGGDAPPLAPPGWSTARVDAKASLHMR